MQPGKCIENGIKNWAIHSCKYKEKLLPFLLYYHRGKLPNYVVVFPKYFYFIHSLCCWLPHPEFCLLSQNLNTDSCRHTLSNSAWIFPPYFYIKRVYMWLSSEQRPPENNCSLPRLSGSQQVSLNRIAAIFIMGIWKNKCSS